MKNDITGLAKAIKKAHGCKAVHAASVPVVERFRGRTVWDGTVEEFTINHAKAVRCFAWCVPDPKGKRVERYVTILGVSPVATPADAVRAFIASEFRSG